MSYAVNNETKGESDFIFFAPGISENVLLDKVSYESPKKDGSGDKCLLFDFIGPKGEKFRHVEFPIADNDEKAASKIESLGKRIKHILNKFLPEDKIVITGENFEQFSKGVIGLLGNNYKTTKLRIKLVYNDSDRLVFTKYLSFIEKMETNPTQLRIGKDEKVAPSNTKPTNMETLSPVVNKDAF